MKKQPLKTKKPQFIYELGLFSFQRLLFHKVWFTIYGR